MIQGLRSHTKPNPMVRAIMRTPPELKRMALFWGQIGSGKSLSKRSLMEKYHDNLNYKIIIMWGGDRNEHLYWSLPSHQKKYWDKVKRLMNLNEEGVKQYKVNLLYPMSKDTMKSELPFLKKDDKIMVDSKVFTIPILDIDSDDITLCTGVGTNASYMQMQSLWRDSLDKMTKKDNGADLLKYIDELDGNKSTLYKNFIKPLVSHRLLSAKNCPYNLDLIKEFKDRETITVFCFDLIEKEFRLFIMNWIERNLNTLVTAAKVTDKNIISIEEAAEFFRVADDSVTNETYKIFRGKITHYARMGRRGTYHFLDAQSPKETRGIIEGNEDICVIGRLTGENDKEALLRQYLNAGQLKEEQRNDIPHLNSGEYYMIQGMKDAIKVYFFLPRSSYWEKGDGDFYEHVWKSRVNTWKNISNDIDNLEEEFQIRHKAIIEQQKLDNELRKQKEERELAKKLDEERKIIERREVIKIEAREAARIKARKPGKQVLGTKTADTSSPGGQIVEVEEPEDLNDEEPLEFEL
jgi:hypothetical protein